MGGVAIAAILVTACLATGGDHPYADLSDRQLEYLIPAAASWSPGDPCGDDCPGAIPLEVLDDAIWHDVIAVRRPPAGQMRTNVVSFTIDVGAGTRTVDVPMSIDDPDRIRAAHDAFDLVIARPRDSTWVSVIPVAVDERGRVAFVGRFVGAVVAPTFTEFAVDIGAGSGAEAIDTLRGG